MIIMASKTYIIVGSGIIFLVMIGIFIFVSYLKPKIREFPEIKSCIMGIDVDYDTNMKVKDFSDVENVFGKFVADAKENKKKIFGHDSYYYKFKSATIHGTYEGKKYWKVTAEYYETDPENSFAYGKWMPEEVFDVNEEGEVVRLLGCI